MGSQSHLPPPTLHFITDELRQIYDATLLKIPQELTKDKQDCRAFKAGRCAERAPDILVPRATRRIVTNQYTTCPRNDELWERKCARGEASGRGGGVVCNP